MGKKESDFSQYFLKDKDIYVGLDISVSSTGFCAYNKIDDKWLYYFFPQRKREESFRWNQGNNYILAFNKIDNYRSNEERYHQIVIQILGLFDLFERKTKKIGIGIEDYAFGAFSSGSQSVSTLAQLGGILRYEIYKRGYEYIEISPSTIKKFYSGSGSSNKSGMFFSFKDHTNLDLFEILGFDEKSRLNAVKPIEDICDSHAICSLVKGDKLIVKKETITDNLIKIMQGEING